MGEGGARVAVAALLLNAAFCAATLYLNDRPQPLAVAQRAGPGGASWVYYVELVSNDGSKQIHWYRRLIDYRDQVDDGYMPSALGAHSVRIQRDPRPDQEG